MQKNDIKYELNIRIMMTETNNHPQVTSTYAGDDGEAVAESQKTKKKKAPNEGLDKPKDAGWYVAVVRVNCELRIAKLIQDNLNRDGIWFDYWVPMVKKVYIDRRTNKRKLKDKLFLTTFIFCNVSKLRVNDVRFRSDVYKMLTLPGQSKIYQIPDQVIANYRQFVENEDEPVSAAPVPLKKGIKVRVMAGSMKGVEAYVQSYNGQKAIIGNEIKYISGATLVISRELLELVE